MLVRVKVLAADNVWAVGYNGFDNHALILHYDGTTWAEVPSAAPDANVHLYGIDAAAPDDIGQWEVRWYCVRRGLLDCRYSAERGTFAGS